MQDMHPDTESQDAILRFAQQAVQEAPDCRESRLVEARRALNDQDLMLDAEALASRIIADPLHQVHCEM